MVVAPVVVVAALEAKEATEAVNRFTELHRADLLVATVVNNLNMEDNKVSKVKVVMEVINKDLALHKAMVLLKEVTEGEYCF